MDNMKLLLICILRVLLSYSFKFFKLYFFINVYVVSFLFDNVIYVSFIVMTMYSHCMFMYDYPD
jgi:hypothetical protein